MKKITVISLAVLCAFGLNLKVSAHNHSADETAEAASEAKASMASHIVVEKAWARETFKLARTGAAYITMSNSSDKSVRLVSASVDESVADMVEIHTTEMNNGMMRMMELEDGLVIDAGEKVEFQPGGKHFMLMGLKGPLQAEKELNITLRFEDGSEKSVDMYIQDMRMRSSID
ncbi:copper chaperone PCu(A)C [Glaciecola siphonariae]|uniref:Copper chaperone PCu(A)C n=1 Tax=Glaciecola siphonariae TaxID=521012 RepID=A0ABV9LY78_9ALTE